MNIRVEDAIRADIALVGVGLHSQREEFDQFDMVEHGDALVEARTEYKAVEAAPQDNPADTDGPPDSLDITAQIDGLKHLEDGWFDGDGESFDAHLLDRLADDFVRRYPTDIGRPYLYPTPDGAVRVEWSLGPHEVSLEIDLKAYTAYWHRLDFSTDGSEARELDLGSAESWTWWLDEIRRLGA